MEKSVPVDQEERWPVSGETVPVRIPPGGTKLFTQFQGDGDLGGTKFKVFSVVPMGSLIIRFPGKEYIVETQDVIRTAYEHYRKLREEKG